MAHAIIEMKRSEIEMALLKYLKKFVQEVNFYPLQGAYGEGNNNFLVFILFKHIEDGGESIDSVNSDYSAS